MNAFQPLAVIAVTRIAGLERWLAAFLPAGAQAPVDRSAMHDLLADRRALRREASARAERPPLPLC